MIYWNNENVFCNRLTIALPKSQEITIKIKPIPLTSSKHHSLWDVKGDWDGRMHQQTRCIKIVYVCWEGVIAKMLSGLKLSGHCVTSQNRQALTADDLLKQEPAVSCFKDLQWNSFEVTLCTFWCTRLKIT